MRFLLQFLLYRVLEIRSEGLVGRNHALLKFETRILTIHIRRYLSFHNFPCICIFKNHKSLSKICFTQKYYDLQIVEDNEYLQREIAETRKKHGEAVSRQEIQYDRSEAQIAMLKENLEKTEKSLSDNQSENKALQKANSKLLLDYSAIAQEKANMDLQIRKMQLDLAHERNRNAPSFSDPFDRLKFPILENTNDKDHEEGTQNITNFSLSRNPSFDGSSSSEMPDQINDIMRRLGDIDDEDDEIFRIPSPPPSTQDVNPSNDDERVFRKPLPSRKRQYPKEEQHVVPLNKNEVDEESRGTPTSSGVKRKASERRNMVDEEYGGPSTRKASERRTMVTNLVLILITFITNQFSALPNSEGESNHQKLGIGSKNEEARCYC